MTATLALLAGLPPAAGEAAPAASTGSDFTSMVYVLMLATFIGLGVITRVSRKNV